MLALNDSRFAGSLMWVRSLHVLNTSVPSVVTLSGIAIEVRLSHHSNAALPISLRAVPSNVTSVRLLQ